MVDRKPGIKTAPPFEENAYLHSTPITASSPAGAGPQTQQEFMETLSHELVDAVFEATDLLEGVYPCPEELYPRIDAFVQQELKKPRPFQVVERDNYQPLADFLSAILAIIPPEIRQGTYYEKITFSVYDRPMKDLVDGRGKLQPDILASPVASLIKEWLNVEVAVEVKDNWPELLLQAAMYGCAMLEQSLRWFSVVIGFNHKLKQFRFIWYTRKGSFQTGCLRYSSKKELTTFVRGLVGLAMVSALGAGKDLFKSRSSALLLRLPLVPKRLLSTPSPPDSCIWRVDVVLCQRICILGRGTHVYRVLFADPLVNPVDKTANELTGVLKLLPPPPPLCGTVVTVKWPGPYHTRQRTKEEAVAKAAKKIPYPQTIGVGVKAPYLQKLGDTIDAGIDILLMPSSRNVQSTEDFQPSVYKDFKFSEIDTPFVVEDGHAVITKESWPIAQQGRVELEMFQSMQGQHGIPDVLGGCNVPHNMDIFTGLSSFERCADWSISSPLDQPLTPEERTHQLMFIGTEGFILTAEPSTEIIVHAVIDTIVGHLNLFLNGYLHRDVAIGNVLRRRQVQKRSEADIQKNSFAKNPLFDFLAKHPHARQCYGTIIDGDMAVKWIEDREGARHGSGTTQFMSRRILKEWPTHPLRTAIDDLESFSWVLLWVALHKSDQKTGTEEIWLQGLSSDNINTVAARKAEILLSAIELAFDDTDDFSHPLADVLPLLQSWWSVAWIASTSLRKLVSKHSKGKAGVDDILKDDVSRLTFYKELEALSLEYYVKYIQLGTDFLMESEFYSKLSSLSL